MREVLWRKIIVCLLLFQQMAADDRSDLIEEIQKLVGPSVPQANITELLDQIVKNKGSLSAESFRRVVIQPLRHFRVALLVVDFQNDFVSGSLAIGQGDAGQEPVEALPSLNSLLAEPNIDMVVYTQDWHPFNHISFYEHARNSDRVLSENDRVRKLRPFDVVQFDKPNTSQVLYPSHCVQGSWGAELHNQLVIVKDSVFIKKGIEVLVDSYSAFGDNHGKKKSELEDILRADGITAVLACGLAYDICVFHTLKDAVNLGFLSALITDCSKGLSTEAMQETNVTLSSKHAAIINESTARQILHRDIVPFEWVQRLAQNL